MPATTDEEIRICRERWEKYPKLASKIVEILKGNSPALLDEGEAAKRLWRVNSLIRSETSSDFNTNMAINVSAFLDNSTYILLDLKGFPGIEFDLSNVLFIRVDLTGAQFRNANLRKCRFSYSALDWADMRSSDLQEADFTPFTRMVGVLLGSANLAGASLSMAHLEAASFNGSTTNLRKTDFRSAHLEGAHFIDADISGAVFKGAFCGRWVGRMAYGYNFVPGGLDQDRRTTFGNNKYIPSIVDAAIGGKLKKRYYWEDVEPKFHLLDHAFTRCWVNPSPLARLLLDRWFYTDFGSFHIEECDTIVSGTDLRRYVEDQHILRRMRTTAPISYWFWNLTTACGWSTMRLMFWAIITIIFFATIYAWIPNLVANDPINGVSSSLQWFYLSFDIFTNLGIRVTTKPASNWGVVVMFMETILGWMTLGLAITVFANKYARRS